jgi:hypothetical protein
MAGGAVAAPRKNEEFASVGNPTSVTVAEDGLR